MKGKHQAASSTCVHSPGIWRNANEEALGILQVHVYREEEGRL